MSKKARRILRHAVMILNGVLVVFTVRLSRFHCHCSLS